MSRAWVPAALTVLWSVAAYLVTVVAVLGAKGMDGDGPDAGDALALVLLVLAALSVLLLVLSWVVRARALVTALWTVFVGSLVVGVALLVVASSA